MHALQSSVHVDLQKRDGTRYPASAITTILNKNFNRNNLPIRILKTIDVPDTFHCRYNANARSYLYRIAVAKNGPIDSDKITYEKLTAHIPIEDIDRCFYIQ